MALSATTHRAAGFVFAGRFVCLFVLGLARPVLAEDTSEALQPPRLLSEASIVIPEDAPRLTAPVTVRVLIRVDAEGEVAWVKLLSEVTPLRQPYNDAVLTQVTSLRFEPARYRGEPVEVEIDFEQVFEADGSPNELSETIPDAELRGAVVEKGTRRPVAFAQVVVEVGDETISVNTDESGSFRVKLPAAPARVEVVSAEHHRFVVFEELAHHEVLQVEYLLERLSYQPYETIVIGKRDRRVVSRTTLRDRELRQVPGTFGDPFRVIASLPGVSQIFSLVPYPVVRGSSPGNTGFLLDGVRVPQLFHLLFAPAVIHPEMIERIDFYPGNFPVKYGGYVGGIVDGITKESKEGDGRLDIDADLLKAGVLLRGPVPFLDGVRGTVAARYGYPFLLLEAFNLGVFLSYWDYQARVDGSAGPGRWQVSTFGAFDELQQERVPGDRTSGRTTTARSMFHRVDLTYRVRAPTQSHEYKVVLGVDEALSGESSTLTTWTINPRATWEVSLARGLSIDTGLEGMFRSFQGGASIGGGLLGDDRGTESSMQGELWQGGAFAAIHWYLNEDLLLIPGVRADTYRNAFATQWSVDPRFLARYRLVELFEDAVWLKAGVGRYHQPPRFIIPVPGFEELALGEGLLASTQLSAGVEVPLPLGFFADAQVYYQDMDPVLFDLAINEPGSGVVAGRRGADEPILTRSQGSFFSPTGFFNRRVGRSYGLEVLIKQESNQRFYGWLSYTLSWSERRLDDQWVPFDFDRRHILNLVAGVSLPRNWDAGLRLQVQSGRPFSDARGFNQSRGSPFVSASIRIDKRAVWDRWLFDFYVDLINITLTPEELDSRVAPIRIGIPTLGVRAVL